MDYTRSIEDVVETLRNAKGRGRNCTLLIGAGCSVKAGIPTAPGFVEVIREEYPQAYNRARRRLADREPTYPACMAELGPTERRDLIARYVDNAKINWAHIGIAQLMKYGYVDRVLTTNFDLLVVRACALINHFPASYDFAASQLFSPADIPDQAVVYLHGQRAGFVLMNTEKECKRHSQLLEPVFQDAGRGRTWVVVGYSGDSDPVFDHLANVPQYGNNLYWLAHLDAEPSQHVQDRLLVGDKYAFYVNGYDADDFFITLAQELDCFPPDLCEKPFQHLERSLDMIASYPIPGQQTDMDVTQKARDMIKYAVKSHNRRSSKKSVKEPINLDVALEAQSMLMAGDYGRIIDMASLYGDDMPQELADTVAQAYAKQAGTLVSMAKTKTGVEADEVFELAYVQYAAALRLKPDYYQALIDWGSTLANQAMTKSGEASDVFFAVACERYEAAVAVEPDRFDAFFRWGIALVSQARMKTGEVADKLFTSAYEKYKTTLMIRPGYHWAYNNWGLALADQAKLKMGTEADGLLALACEKYEATVKIKSDYYWAYSNWGLALAGRAKLKTGEEADRLLTLAGNKYDAALKIKSDFKPASNNWGILLMKQGASKAGKKRNRLFTLAEERFLAVLPEYGPYNLACLRSLQGDEAGCREWLEKGMETGILPSREHIQKDSDLDNVRTRKWFKDFLASL